MAEEIYVDPCDVIDVHYYVQSNSIGQVKSMRFETDSYCGKGGITLFYEGVISDIEDVMSKGITGLKVEKVVFNPPYTIVIFGDGIKEIVKVDDYDVFSPEVGVAMAIAKRIFGNYSEFTKFVDKFVKKAKCPFCKSLCNFDYETEKYYCLNDECSVFSFYSNRKK